MNGYAILAKACWEAKQKHGLNDKDINKLLHDLQKTYEKRARDA